MSGPWDQPGADPYGDLLMALANLKAATHRPRVFFCPSPLSQIWESVYGHRLTVEELNTVTGPYGMHYDEIVFAEPLSKPLPAVARSTRGPRPQLVIYDEAQDYAPLQPQWRPGWLNFCVEAVAHG